MKCTSREACVERYGPIDFAKRRWPNQADWMKHINVPDGWFSHWHGPTGTCVSGLYVNKDIADPLLKALKAVFDGGLGDLLKTFDGCFNIRMVRGTNDLFSAHSYGLAIDINADDNPLAATSGGFYDHPKLVNCFTAQGFDWGGNFTHRKDPMHFSYCWE